MPFVLVDCEEDLKDAEDAGPTERKIRNHYKIVSVRSKKGTAKNVICTFQDTKFSCCSSLALALILGRPVLGRSRPNIRVCVSDDNQCTLFKLLKGFSQ